MPITSASASASAPLSQEPPLTARQRREDRQRHEQGISGLIDRMIALSPLLDQRDECRRLHEEIRQEPGAERAAAEARRRWQRRGFWTLTGVVLLADGLVLLPGLADSLAGNFLGADGHVPDLARWTCRGALTACNATVLVGVKFLCRADEHAEIAAATTDDRALDHAERALASARRWKWLYLAVVAAAMLLNLNAQTEKDASAGDNREILARMAALSRSSAPAPESAPASGGESAAAKAPGSSPAGGKWTPPWDAAPLAMLLLLHLLAMQAPTGGLEPLPLAGCTRESVARTERKLNARIAPALLRLASIYAEAKDDPDAMAALSQRSPQRVIDEVTAYLDGRSQPSPAPAPAVASAAPAAAPAAAAAVPPNVDPWAGKS